MRRLLLFFFAIAPLFALLHEARAVTYSLFSKPSSGLDIDLMLPWDELPFDRPGYFPVQIRIQNKSTRDGRWTLTSNSNSNRHGDGIHMNSAHPLEVPSGETRTFRLLLPMADTQGYHNMRLDLTGTGITEQVGQYFNSNTYHHGNLLHFGGISEDLHTEHGGLLDNKARSGSNEIHFASIDPKLAPEDWRAYITFDSVYFSEDSWDDLPPGARRAILDWVSAGGQLRLLVGDDPLTKSLSDIPDGQRTRHAGIGHVTLFNGDDKALRKQINHETTFTRTRNGKEHKETRIAAFDQGYDAFFNFRYNPARVSSFDIGSGANPSSSEKMAELLRKANEDSGLFEDSIDIDGANFTLIILSVIAFGVIVGPVNFFVFAKGRNRWRVFITIPAISLIFCVLIVGSIILSDGFGGDGRTSRIVVIDPVRKSKAYLQDELSVTGILMNGDFTIPATGTYQHIGSKLPETGMKASGTFDQSGTRYSGDYFESRRLQHNRLVDVTPSREAIILQGQPDAPELVSNLQASCDVVFFRDDEGKYWKAEGLGVGRTVKAKPSDIHEFSNWWGQRKQRGGMGSIFASIPELGARKSWFYADAQPVQDAYPESLKSINWQNHQTIITGPLVKKGES